MNNQIPLNTLQRWLQAVITDPDGVEAGIAHSLRWVEAGTDDGKSASVESIIPRSKRQAAVDRLRIYGHAYFGRLLECLQTQFPAVRQATGATAFDGLAFGYLVNHPSSSYTLAKLGSSFASYLSQTRPKRAVDPDSASPDFADFVIELARLEQAYNEVFDGPGPERSESLNVQDLVGLSPGEFARSSLKFHASVRLLQFQFPVHQYATIVRHRSRPHDSSPVGGSDFNLTPAAIRGSNQPTNEEENVSPDIVHEFVARPVHLVITRRDYIVRRFEVSPIQFQLLQFLDRDVSIENGLKSLLSDHPLLAETLNHDLRSWFETWTAAPLFSALVPPRKSVA